MHRSKMQSVARSLKQNLRTDPGVQGPLQWGTIASITTGGAFDTAGVYLDSASGQPGAVITTGIPWMNGYKPTVGDVVLILRMGGAARTQRVILGPLETVNHGLTQAGVADVTSLVSAGPITLPPVAGGTVAPTSYGSIPVKIDEKSGALSTYDFTSIPTGFRSIEIRYHLRDNSATNGLVVWSLRFNGVTGNYFSGAWYMRGGSTALVQTEQATAQTSANFTIIGAGGALTDANVYTNGLIRIDSYADNTAEKSGWAEDALNLGTHITGDMFKGFSAFALSALTGAVTEVNLIPTNTAWSSNSWAELWGIP